MGTTSSTQGRWTAPEKGDRPHGEIGVRVVLFIVGFSPITVLALSLVEVAPLALVGPPVVGAAALAVGWLMARHPPARPILARGLAGGLIAVLVYDAARLPFVVLGGWPDFIPRIGAWLLDDDRAHWTLGYAWRYLGNGAGMGLAFATFAPGLSRLIGGRRAGVLYGVAIWSGLLATIGIAPNGQEKMFRLTPSTLLLSLLGHLIYGAVLGHLATRRSNDVDVTPAG